MGLEIAGLTVHYGGVAALESLDLVIPPGELFVLLGGSGSGKTTLLRAIAGFLRPTAGRIMLDGTDLTPLPPYRRPVNTMFQSYALFPHMTVAANIAFGLRRQGISRAEISARVTEMLALVRLDGFGDRRPDALSGGQQQRVALARSLAPNPRLLLLDEPLSALDRGLRADTRAELVRLQQRLGTSFILVTHDQEEALSMAHRIGVMAGGRLAQVGTPAEIYERPANRFVAEFVGAANVLMGEIGPDGMFHVPALDLWVRTSRGPASIRSAVPEGAGRPTPALLAVRPERMRLTGGSNRIEGEVREIAYAGQTVTYVVQLRDGSRLRVMQSLSDGFDPLRHPVGARITLGFEPESCIVLPPA